MDASVGPVEGKECDEGAGVEGDTVEGSLALVVSAYDTVKQISAEVEISKALGGRDVVFCGLRRREDLNDKRGKARERRKDGKFLVEVCGTIETVVCAEANLRPWGERDADDAQVAPPHLEMAIRPGTLFAGDIVIPGVSAEAASVEREPYSVEVVRPIALDDAWGHEPGKHQFMVSHTAYGDTQQCEMTVVENARTADADEAKGEGRVPGRTTGQVRYAVNYADAETLCTGTLEISSGPPDSDSPVKVVSLQGRVNQLVQGDDEGFQHPSEEATHYFRLVACNEGNGGADRRVRLGEARAALVEAMGKLRAAVESSSLPVAPWTNVAPTLGALAESAWIEAFRGLDRSANGACAELRRHARHLQRATFATEAAKVERLAFLAKAAGVSRSAAHAATDRVLAEVNTVLQLWHVARPGSQTEDTMQAASMAHLAVPRRLDAAYRLFDSAYRSAETRLTTDLTRSWLVPRRSPLVPPGTMCAICFCPLVEPGGGADVCPRVEPVDDADAGDGDGDGVSAGDAEGGPSGGAAAGGGILATASSGDCELLEEVMHLPCGHFFDESCIKPWLHRNASCPNCRCSLPPKKLTPAGADGSDDTI